MTDLTVFIITSGEASLGECLKAIEAQKVSGEPRIEIIKDVYPVSEAFNEMYRRSKTPYFIQVDADVILTSDAIAILYQAVKKTTFFVYSVYGQLYEEGFGPGGSVRCWKKSIFNIFKFRDIRATDRDFYKRAMMLGFHRKNVGKTLGIHRPRQSDFLDYWKTKGDVEKWQFLKRPFKMYAEDLYRSLIAEPHENRYKILGFLTGVATSKERIQKSKNTLHEQVRIESVFRFLEMDFKEFALKEKTDFSKLLEIAKSAYLDYRTSKKKLLINNIFNHLLERELSLSDLEKMYCILSN